MPLNDYHHIITSSVGKASGNISVSLRIGLTVFTTGSDPNPGRIIDPMTGFITGLSLTAEKGSADDPNGSLAPKGSDLTENGSAAFANGSSKPSSGFDPNPVSASPPKKSSWAGGGELNKNN